MESLKNLQYNSVLFWDDEAKEIVVVNPPPSDTQMIISEVPFNMFNKFCVDIKHIDPEARYGKFRRYELNKYWSAVPFVEFPAEFKAYLLLLGIS